MSKKSSPKSKQQKATTRKTTSKKPEPRRNVSLAGIRFENLILIIILAAISLIIIIGPFKRGLFFQSELLPIHIISFGLFILWWISKLIRKDGSFLQSPLDWSIFALVVFYFLSFSFTAVNKKTALEELFKIVNYLVIYLFVLDTCKQSNLFNFKKTKEVKGSNLFPEGLTPGLLLLLHVLAISGLAVAVGGVGAATGTWDVHGAYIGGRIFSSLQYPNTTAAYLTASFFLTLSLSSFIDWHKLYIRPLYLAGSTVVFITLILTYSRGAWVLLPFLSILFIMLIGRSERLRMFIYILSSATVTLLLVQRLDAAFQNGEPGAAWPYIFLAVASSFIGGYLLELFLTLNRKLKLIIAGAVLAAVIILSFQVFSPRLTNLQPSELTQAETPGADFKDNASQKATSFSLDRLLPRSVYNRIFSISFEDESIEGRFAFYRDALKIIKDYPILGAGGGAWKALYYSYQESRYFTTEVHSHFLQVWVETGTLGFITFLCIWISFTVAFVRSNLNPSVVPIKKKAWVAAFIPTLALGVHSIFDFNLSLGAVSIYLFVLLGAGNSLNNNGCYKCAFLKQINLSNKPWITCLIGIILSLVLFIVSISLWQGYKAGAMAEEKAAENDFGQALELFEKATRNDPYNAFNYANLARIYEHLATFEENVSVAPQLHEQVKAFTTRALTLEPYNLSYNLNMARILLARGEIPEGLFYMDRAIELHPYSPSVFLQAANAYLAVAEHYLASGEKEKAEEILNKLLLLEERMAEYHKNTNTIAFYLGQAAFLLQGYDNAGHYFAQVPPTDESYLKSQVYLTVLSKMTGKDELAAELQETFIQDAEMADLYNRLLDNYLKDWVLYPGR